jgi:hypothetical protein
MEQYICLSFQLLHMFKVQFTRGLFGKYSAILNISRNGCVALVYLGSQSEETVLYIFERSLYRGVSQSALRRRWLSLCIDMDMSYTRVLLFKVAYRLPHKWLHALYVTRPLLCTRITCYVSYNTLPLLCARITCYVTVITVEINHCSFRRVRFALLYIVTRSKIV